MLQFIAKKWPLAAVTMVLAVGAGGCQKNIRAAVNCVTVPASNSVACTVTHTEGSVRANVCWTVNLTCTNGNHVTGSACQVVDPHAVVQTNIPTERLIGLNQCNGGTAMAVENLQITAQP